MANKIVNVLIYPGGMENGIEVYRSLRYCKEVKLFSATSRVMNHAFYLYTENRIIRDVNEEGWIDDLNAVISQDNIDIVFPVHTIVIERLSKHRSLINALLVLASESVINITSSKKATIQALRDSLPTPFQYNSLNEIADYPIFIKPDMGYGSQGAKVITNIEDAKSIDFDKNIVQEYLSGAEYTVDCFSSESGELLYACGRKRSRIRMATSMHAEVVTDLDQKRFEYLARQIQNTIKLTGAWFFQLKKNSAGEFKLLEVDARIAGTMCFSRCRGVNFSLLSIHQKMGRDVSVLVNDVNLSLDRCLHNRYIIDIEYDTVFVDLDDTIVVHKKLNTELIAFLYQCVNNNISIVLISKYLGEDRDAYLNKWRINALFDRKIWLKEGDSKVDYINPERSIFIDDSYSQRLEVHRKLGIPTFDASMVEALIDDRI